MIEPFQQVETGNVPAKGNNVIVVVRWLVTQSTHQAPVVLIPDNMYSDPSFLSWQWQIRQFEPKQGSSLGAYFYLYNAYFFTRFYFVPIVRIDDSNKWTNIEFGEEITQEVLIEVTFTCSQDSE